MSRPYMRLRIDQLTAIADDPTTSPEARERLMEELQFRNSQGARKLLARMRGGGAPGGERAIPTVARGRAAREREIPPAPDPLEMPPEAIDREAALAALRETYTIGAEILARWGMTTAIDEELFDVVVDWWSGKVSDQPDRFGRSRSSLAHDVSRLRSLGSFGGGDGTRDD